MTNSSEITKWFADNGITINRNTKLTAIRDVVNNNIAYIVDEELRDMPYRTGQYTGKFDVLSISNSQREVLVDGVTTKQAIKLYTLDKLTYSDKGKDLDQTELIRVGDELMVAGGSKNTRYRINKLDSSTRQVELRLIEGYEPIKIGANALGIYKNEDNNLQIEVPCGFNERVLMFMKAIDADSKLLAENWSPGVGYYTNELLLTQEDGVKITLAEYYKENVADFSRMIDALKVDWREDPNSDKTPFRVAKAYVNDLWAGRYEAPPAITTFPSDGYDGIVFEGGIPLTSMCSHHHQTIMGVVHVAYIPVSYTHLTLPTNREV